MCGTRRRTRGFNPRTGHLRQQRHPRHRQRRCLNLGPHRTSHPVAQCQLPQLRGRALLLLKSPWKLIRLAQPPPLKRRRLNFPQPRHHLEKRRFLRALRRHCHNHNRPRLHRHCHRQPLRPPSSPLLQELLRRRHHQRWWTPRWWRPRRTSWRCCNPKATRRCF